MTESIAELIERLVIRRKRDGRCVYDAGAKLELIQACRQRGISMAKFARECGVNANQLSSWVRQYELDLARTLHPEEATDDGPAFVPIRIESPRLDKAAPATVGLQVRLPNGVVVELQGCDAQQAGSLIQVLGSLRCSASTKG